MDEASKMVSRRIAERKAKAWAKWLLRFDINNPQWPLSTSEMNRLIGKQAHAKTPLYQPLTHNPRKRGKGEQRDTVGERIAQLRHTEGIKEATQAMADA